MQMKFSQSLAYILRHFGDIARELKNGQRGAELLNTWNIDFNEPIQINQILAERGAMCYLNGSEKRLIQGKDTLQPAMNNLKSAFTRHLVYLGAMTSC